MKNKQSVVVFEHTWNGSYEFMPEDDRAWTRSFRIVAWSWEHDDGVRRIGSLHYEELSEDCLGKPIWNTNEMEHVPGAAMAALLMLAGKLPADTDTSDISG